MRQYLSTFLVVIYFGVGVVYISSCGETSEHTLYKGNVSGYVKDSLTGNPLWGARITVYPGNVVGNTDSTGYYLVKDVYLPTSSWSGSITTEYPGYITKVTGTYLKHNVTNFEDTIKLIPAK